uniref:Uncharacterized protein n=1 Tax=viral metagenome TaxID=1070528 RepID=A0A6C0KBT0_9ZZZZ
MNFGDSDIGTNFFFFATVHDERGRRNHTQPS